MTTMTETTAAPAIARPEMGHDEFVKLPKQTKKNLLWRWEAPEGEITPLPVKCPRVGKMDGIKAAGLLQSTDPKRLGINCVHLDPEGWIIGTDGRALIGLRDHMIVENRSIPDNGIPFPQWRNVVPKEYEMIPGAGRVDLEELRGKARNLSELNRKAMRFENEIPVRILGNHYNPMYLERVAKAAIGVGYRYCRLGFAGEYKCPAQILRIDLDDLGCSTSFALVMPIVGNRNVQISCWSTLEFE